MIRWIFASTFLATVISPVYVGAESSNMPIVLVGQDKSKEKEKDKTTTEHTKYGPHKGPLAEWDDIYHAEFTVDHAKKMVTVYLLDERASKAPKIEAARFSKIKLVVSDAKVVLELKHDPKRSGPGGIVFTGSHEFFAKPTAFKGNLSGVLDETTKIEKRYSDDFEYNPKKSAGKKMACEE